MKGASFRRLSGWGVVLLVFLVTGVPLGAVQADIGIPPVNPSGSSLGVAEGERTNVRMVEEEVNLTIEPTTAEVPGGYHMRGRVEAVFLMRNLGATDKALDVWFPLTASARFQTMFPLVPDKFVQDFQIWVNGQPEQIETVRIKKGGPNVEDQDREIHWASFPITFPSGKDVSVRVTYTIYPSGWQPFGGFEYILQTGASWNGTIGKAVIKVHLPYAVTKENVSQSGISLLGEPLAPQPPGYIIEDDGATGIIRWEFTDLEPGEQDNIFIDVLEPQRYQDLVDARSQAAKQPDSADAQLALAKASSGAILVLKGVNQNGGGADLAEQVKVAYRRALELAPDREDILVAYVNWLMMGEGYMSLMVHGTCPAEACDLLDRALKLYPNNPDLITMNADVQPLRTQAAVQALYDQTSTAVMENRQATEKASTATARADAAQPTITPTVPATMTPRLANMSADSSPSPSPATAIAPAARQKAHNPQPGLVITGLTLVVIVVVVLILRSSQLSSRK
jgi:hypothetical protein